MEFEPPIMGVVRAQLIGGIIRQGSPAAKLDRRVGSFTKGSFGTSSHFRLFWTWFSNSTVLSCSRLSRSPAARFRSRPGFCRGCIYILGQGKLKHWMKYQECTSDTLVLNSLPAPSPANTSKCTRPTHLAKLERSGDKLTHS